jgi:bacterioferritin (cytochrome b1)
MSDKPEPMDVEAVLECLNKALALQQRCVLQYTAASGSMFGIEVQGVASQLWHFAREELDDLRRLVEKITALGGDPSTDVAPVSWSPDPRTALTELADHEEALLDALKAAITPSGQEARSEALEHLMEHMILRKQNQVDWMRRALREP